MNDPSANTTSPKRPRLDGDHEEDKTKMDASTSNQEQSPLIYQLPVELLTDIFDLLELEDLGAVGQTSKLFRQIAGSCFEKNFSALDEICFKNSSNLFYQLYERVKVLHYRKENPTYKHLVNSWSQFQKLKAIALHVFDNHFEDMKEIRNNIEDLELMSAKIDTELIRSLPQLFPNLKRLSMRTGYTRSEPILCKFPNLESFEITKNEHCSQDIIDTVRKDIIPFLQINPNIRNLGICARWIWDSRELLKAALPLLDDLAIDIDEVFPHSNEITPLFQLLIELYQLGFYKRLKVYLFSSPNSFYISKKVTDGLALLPGLTKLYFNVQRHIRRNHQTQEIEYTNRIALSAIHRLEEIYIGHSYDIADIELSATLLQNLKCIEYENADLNDLLPLVNNAIKLEKIKVGRFIHTARKITITDQKVFFLNGAYFEEQQVINLSMLNSGRSKLPMGKTVITLYVEEKVFLATKWAMATIDFAFIKMRRATSCKWVHDFDRRYNDDFRNRQTTLYKSSHAFFRYNVYPRQNF